MARWHLVLAAATTAASALFVTPSHAACAAPIVAAPPSGAFMSCTSAASNFSLNVAAGGVYWYVHCLSTGTVVVPTTLTWAGGFSTGPIMPACANAVITLRSAMAGTTATGQLW